MLPVCLHELSTICVIFVLVFLQNGVHPKMAGAPQEGHCIWYGRCALNPDKDDAYFNCFYDGPPKLVEDPTHVTILKNLCPESFDAAGNAYTCCDGDQIIELESSSLKTIGYQLLSKCPSCWDNFRKYFCTVVCGANQSLSMYPLEIEETPGDNPTDPPRQSIKQVELVVSQTLADQLYGSCKDVKSAFNTKVMDVLCGQHSDTCTATAFVTYLGDNPLAPFPTAVIVTDQPTVQRHGRTFKPFNIPVTPCHLPTEIDGPTCSCSDCEAACRTHGFSGFCELKKSKATFVLGMESFTLFAILMYMVLAGLFLLCVVIIHFRKKRRNAQPRRERLTDSSAAETSKESLPLQAPIAASADDGKSDPPASPTHGDNNGFIHSQEAGPTPTSKLPITEIVFAASTYYSALTYKFEEKVEEIFMRWGRFCAKHPAIILSTGLFFSISLTLGLIFFKVETDPIALWSTPTSRGRVEMDYFHAHFQPMKRIEQVIVVPSHPKKFTYKGEILGPVFDWEFLMEVMKLQEKIESLTATLEGNTVRFSDICYKPLSPDIDKCAVMSIFNFLQNDYAKIASMPEANFIDHIQGCVLNPMNYNCFGAFGGPVFPFLVFGGMEEKEFFTASALALTFVADNYYDTTKTDKAMAWEEEFLHFLNNYESPHMEVYYYSGRSVHDQLIEESHADIPTVIFSYVIMFCYIAIGLGQAHSCRGLLVDSKITLGFCGTVLVTLSVLSSIGIFGFLQVPATLIVLEVVPFMVLAVGVDNIFILVQAYQRDIRQPNESRHDQIGRVVGDVAPSMLLSSITDALGFYLGALSSMPAVRTFGLYAGTACVVAFLLQISSFVSLLGLDAKRHEDNRLDVCCCVRDHKREASAHVGLMYRFVKNVYSPILLKTSVRVVVVLVFLGWLCSSVAVINKINVGLEPELSMAKDSYVYEYLTAFKKYLAIGPPVYFILKGNVNYSSADIQVMLCNSAGCADNSMLAHIAYAADHPETSYIGQSAQSWLDDYQAWMRSGCCQEHKVTKEFCPSSTKKKPGQCKDCDFTTQTTNWFRHVVGPDFVHYLPFFLRDNPTRDGCIGGHASYSGTIEFVDDGKQIGATLFTAYHTVLKTSEDHYQALLSARCIADSLTKLLNDHLPPSLDGQPYEVFPYSMFYVFYEQYLTMWTDTLLNLFFSSLTIFFLAFLILGLNLHLSAIIVFTVIVIVTNLLGAMYWWDIQLNAIALVNLVVAVGIAVEFCSHISRAFAVSVEETKLLRTQEALVTMGSSVLSGITITKFSGIVVLAFARSQLFQIYYFRINLCIVLFGATHGLIFLPVLLSFFGPRISKNKLLRLQQQIAQRQLQEQEIQS